MISKATIEQKINDYSYKVRIPFLNKATNDPDATLTKDLYVASISQQPGINPSFSVGDVVYVAFDLDKVYSPVIMGELYREGVSGSVSNINLNSTQIDVWSEEKEEYPIGKIINNLVIVNEKVDKVIGSGWVTEPVMNAAIAAAINAKAPVKSTATMLAASWSGSTYSFESAFPSATYDIEVEIAPAATQAQYKAYGKAMLAGSSNSNTVTAIGTVPTVDIPIIITARRK